LLGHVSIQTTERHLGCKQKLRVAVNDRLGIEPGAAWTVLPGRMLQSALGDRSLLSRWEDVSSSSWRGCARMNAGA